jgi:hypothetical protein
MLGEFAIPAVAGIGLRPFDELEVRPVFEDNKRVLSRGVLMLATGKNVKAKRAVVGDSTCQIRYRDDEVVKLKFRSRRTLLSKFRHRASPLKAASVSATPCSITACRHR